MTWIVGKQFLPGYVALFSDIQVTWNNGSIREDCLKKVYPVANNIIAGFSGSVDIGFRLLYDLNSCIAEIGGKGNPLIPRIIARRWYRRARRIFKSFPREHQNLGCSIIMAGVSPTESNGNTDLPRTDITVFRNSNFFEPKFIPFLKSASIGSGNNVQAYVDFLDGLDDMENFVSLSNADYNPGGAGEQLAFLASIVLQKHQVPGISHHVHCTLVSRLGWKQFPLNFTTYDGDDRKIETVMPNVAESYMDFQNLQKQLLKGQGQGSA